MSPLFRYDTLGYVLTYCIVDNMPQNKKEAIDNGTQPKLDRRLVSTPLHICEFLAVEVE